MLSHMLKSPKALVFLQFIPVLLVPPSIFRQVAVLALTELLFLVAVVVGVYQSRAWSQTLSIFVMGFNFITKLMLIFPHLVSESGQVDFLFGAIMVTSIALSGVLLYYMDTPEVAVRIAGRR